MSTENEVITDAEGHELYDGKKFAWIQIAKEKRLYELIWKRTIASQMADAQLEKTTININIGNTSEKFVATGEVVSFDGFLITFSTRPSCQLNNQTETDDVYLQLAIDADNGIIGFIVALLGEVMLPFIEPCLSFFCE